MASPVQYSSPSRSPRLSPLTPAPRRVTPGKPDSPAIQYNPHWRYVIDILSYALVAYLVLATWMFLDHEGVTTCNKSPYLRKNNPDVLGTAPIDAGTRRMIFLGGVWFVLVAYFVALLRLSKSWLGATVNVGLLVGVYFVGLAVVEYLKKASGDYACHTTKGNGVSGHFFFIAYQFFSIRYLGKLLKRMMTADIYLVELFAITFALLCFTVEGFFTYHYGYHSVKQILYGIIMGMLFSAFAISVSEFYLLSQHVKYLKEQLKLQ